MQDKGDDMKRTMVGLTLVLAMACGGNGPTTPPVAVEAIAGSWTGQVPVGGAGYATLTLTLTHSNGNVSGNGMMGVGTTQLPQTVTGSYVGSTISLTLTSTGYSPMNFTGQVGTNRMTGLLNGSGFVNAAVTLNR